MLEKLIRYSIQNKLIVLLFTAAIIGFGLFSLFQIPIGAVPDVTNNQVQVITTSRNLSTQDVEQFITYPIELEMANLPGVKEIRSISKFGLSVVTIVFEDDMGTYLPRQLIGERIKSAEEKIPQGFGSPFMGPVTTGLGEIYQYILDVKPGYEDRYSITELRTIQDWIVKRQLSGIAGVVEVNTWGGKLKQYEVAVNPDRLRTTGISVHEVFSALENNNSVAGGGYIEKTHESYFIRGEGLITSLEDIENIIVKKRGDVPVYIRDIASVRFGFATRFGAITANGEGEKVLGQVMMLKDANPKAVIDRVRERVETVQKALPEGLFINAFLDRSELISKTTTTVAENLILGCLIVIFVVVLLLGNVRSGLVVASVIPLSLLFALSMMNIFGVNANLMSLGAIDFGIIIDGAVIIVEYIAYKITAQKQRFLNLDLEEKQSSIDRITFESASKMMRSAIFGQLIIIIVFIPILSLSEVEGKMFKPMALTFCFALIGAMILCFTYVPVVSSLFLKPASTDKKNISERLISFLEELYTPTVYWALKHKAAVLSLAVGLLITIGILFSTMGGEFVPTLDEGDFVIQPVLKTGTSLSKTIETTTEIEKILRGFPEVKQVVTRIGAAEVPTDPMSMEETDVIITLNPPSSWTSAKSKDDLADRFKEALSELPGLDYEFTQPIEMRFNELITGVRADLAIKIFGEDLSVLNDLAQNVRRAIQEVEGAADISIEKVEGLPQMMTRFKRDKIARYGLNIKDVSDMLTMSFAGLPAGSVFEGERQFDLVVRYDEAHRKDIENIRTSTFIMPDGTQIPFSEIADISYTRGPAKISRDDTKRRIVVGVNVRNRDLESVVEDVQRIIEREVDMPPGYIVDYGGQFENLRNARERLMVAVPVALLLIFIMLYFAFGSIREALMVFSAIPLSAVGGVLSLYLRGMPFSISAGVGFIALFGIAVLNGIVLIEHFKELKEKGMDDLCDRILLGTRQRMRPVLLTASAAALGFLPMAISTSAGAEVQRPLATVVVGGLISATLLTLIVLPVLYAIFDKKKEKNKPQKGTGQIAGSATILLVLALSFFPQNGQSQTDPLSLQDAIDIAIENNAGFRSAALMVEREIELINASHNIDKTQVYVGYDENNIAENNRPLAVAGIQQSFKMPGVYKAQKDQIENKAKLQEQQLVLDERSLKKAVSQSFYTILYWENLRQDYQYLDSLYGRFALAANRKYETGESNYLEKLTADARKKEIALQLSQCEASIQAGYQELNKWLQLEEAYSIQMTAFAMIELQEPDLESHPAVRYFSTATELSNSTLRLEKKQLLPDLNLEYFIGTNRAENARLYNGFQLGIGIPLWQKAQRSRIQAAEIHQQITDMQGRDYLAQLAANYQALRAQLDRYKQALDFYQAEGQQLAQQLIFTSSEAFQEGEIDFLEYIQSLEHAKSIEKNYLDNLIQYNLTVLDINYLMN